MFITVTKPPSLHPHYTHTPQVGRGWTPVWSVATLARVPFTVKRPYADTLIKKLNPETIKS